MAAQDKAANNFAVTWWLFNRFQKSNLNMINAQFDLQNIINEMKTGDRAQIARATHKEQFSETLTGYLGLSHQIDVQHRSISLTKNCQNPAEKPISDSRNETDSGSLSGAETDTTQSVVSQSSGSVSGNILPLLPPEHLDESSNARKQRPILVGT